MLKKIVSACFLFLILAGSFFVSKTSPVSAQNYGLDETVNQVEAFKGKTPPSDIGFLQTKAGQIIGTALSFVGILFLILVIYAGIMWMTAQGNEQKVTKAKDLLINSVIGLIIVFAAYAITAFVGDFVTNNILN